MRLILITISIAFLLSTTSTSAQKEYFDRADTYYASKLYKEAILAYEKALEFEKDQPLAIHRLADAYFYTNNFKKAEFYYSKLSEFNGISGHLFNYGLSLKSLGKLNTAKEIFLKLKETDFQRALQFASSCDFVEKQEFSMPLFEVVQYPNLNSKYSDFAPFLLDDKLFFSSGRPFPVEKQTKLEWTNDAFNQYYFADIIDRDSFSKVFAWKDANSQYINNSPLSISANGKMAAITSNNFISGTRQINGSGLLMDIYLYDIDGIDNWNDVSENAFYFNSGNNSETPYSTGHPFLTENADLLFFVSNRPGGYGGFDIYFSSKTKNGWSEPRNLGPSVNSPGNEMSPFYNNGRLYFSSDWHHGYGGLDIFVSVQSANGFSPCQNLGKPVNSPYDDFYFVLNNNSTEGYFASNRPGGVGNEDIYGVRLLRELPKAPKLVLKSGDKFILKDPFKGNSIKTDDSDFKDFLNSLINSNKVVQIFIHSDSRGSAQSNKTLTDKQARLMADYLIKSGIPKERILFEGKGELYTINGCTDAVTCSADEHKVNRRAEFIIVGFLNEKKQFQRDFEPILNPVLNNSNSNRVSNPNKVDPRKITKVLPDIITPAPPPVEKEIIISKPEKKSHYALNDLIEVASIYYQPNSSAVNEKSPGLTQLLEILNSHKHVVIEIAAHTDAKGSSEYNLDLSQRRADALKELLIKKGIAASRLRTKGYGESQIKNHCKDGINCSDREHAVNRRTEFRVVDHTGFKVGDIIKVNEITYEVNRDVLNMKKSRGLTEIIEILKNNSISVEIRSHTDSKGSSDYNMELSERRAKAVYDYLVNNGVNKHRLKYKGYGESILLNKCKDGVNCSNEEHAANRRTDFKVIGLR